MALIEAGNDNTPILTEDVIAQILKTGKWAEDPALTLVIRDAYTAETAKAAKQWIAGWNTGSVVYQSTTVPKYWEGTQVERANIPFYTVAKAVNSLTMWANIKYTVIVAIHYSLNIRFLSAFSTSN